jgi:ABC-2 type transport system permease protein
MKQFRHLLRLNLRLKYGLLEIRGLWRTDRKKAARKIWVGVAAAVGIAYALAFYIFIADNIFRGAVTIGLQGVLLTAALLAGQLVILFFGIFFMIGLYNTKDMELLASLPVPQGRVFAVKFTMALISEITTFAIFILPVLIIFGVHTGADWTFYFKSILVIILGPALPLAISALIAALLMRATALVKRRDLVAVIGGFILFGGIMVGNILLSSSLSGNAANMLGNLLKNQTELFNSIAAGFPPTAWAALGLTGNSLSSLGYLGLFAIVSVAAVILAALFAGRMFYSGALAQLEAPRKKDAIYRDQRSRSVRSPAAAIFVKEWKTVLRSPMYALNSLFGIIMGPILIVMMGLGIGGGGNRSLALLSLLQGNAGLAGAFVVAAVMTFVGAVNPASATCISREGRSRWLCNLVPVPARVQLRGKYLAGLSMSLLGILTTAVAAGFALGIPVFSLIAGALTAALASAAICAIGVAIDLARPKLNWESEQQAIKQNMNAVFTILLSLLLIIILGILAFVMITSGMPAAGIWGVLAGICAVLAVLLYAAMMSKAEKGYEKLKY